MSEGSYFKSNVRCPFYLHDEVQRISCEGLIDGTTATMFFKRRREREKHLRLLCCQRYENCQHAAALLRKYGEEV